MPPRRTQSLLNRRVEVRKPTAGEVHVKPAVHSVSDPSPASKPQLSEQEEAQTVAKITESEAFQQAYTQLVLSQKHSPIHGENLNKIDRLLSSFDMAMKYGPCAGITRLRRFERASKLSQNPPKVVGEILNSPLGQLDRYSWSYIH